MQCPHCGVEFHGEFQYQQVGQDESGQWGVNTSVCPRCDRLTIVLNEPNDPLQEGSVLVHPRRAARRPIPTEVPKQLRSDYSEACAVLADSQKASAALSRRCLQHILREGLNVTPGELAKEIQQVLDSKALPLWLADDLDAVRNVGNFAAHPNKSIVTGEVLEVEPGEAEWLLNVIEALFDFCFVEPARSKARRDALNAKLAEAGKPPMKTSS